MTMLLSPDAVIEALGGPTEAATKLGVKPNVVGNWKIRGKIPPEHFLTVSEALRASDAVPAPEVFGMAPVAPAETAA